MKRIIFPLLILLGIVSCNGQSKKLDVEETKIIQDINLNRELAEKIKQEATGNFETAKGSEELDMLYENIEALKDYSK